jgi:demethylmenaquinone methyltransferase / 2-methoxy-6-polyprenyl-1,4-benzoquinol methylase
MARSISKNRLFRTLFTKLAPFYDLVEPAMTWKQGQLWRALAITTAGLEAPRRILEACAGTGLLTAQLAQAFGARCHIVAIDFCPAMAALARQRLQALNLHRRVEIKVENVEIMPYPEDYADAAFIAFGLRFVSDIRVVFKELYRVLRPGGTVVILELSNPRGPFAKLRGWWRREVLVPRVLAARYRLPPALLHPLHDTLLHYPDPEKLARMLTRSGFENVVTKSLKGGLAALHVGRKALDAKPFLFGEPDGGTGVAGDEAGEEQMGEELNSDE